VFIVQLLRAPGELYTEQQAQIDIVTGKLNAFTRTQEQRDAICLAIARGKSLEEECLAKSDLEVISSEVQAWIEDSLKLLHRLDGGVGILFHAATATDHKPDPQEMRSHDMIDNQYMKYLRMLRAKRRVLEDYLVVITPQPR
jgi:hypothetical protein